MSLRWLPIKFRVQFKILLVTFKALHDQAPTFIKELLLPYIPARSLRSSDQGLLSVPRFRLKTKGDCAFWVVALTLWSSLPLDFCAVDTTDTFKKQFKTHLLRLAFP